MQTLWSRLATTSPRISCRCPSCVSSTTTRSVARRPITAAGKRPKYAYSSTFFYSGIFAAAATTDAAAKQKRREKWEKAIAEVREEIGSPAGHETAPLEGKMEEKADEDVSMAQEGHEAAQPEEKVEGEVEDDMSIAQQAHETAQLEAKMDDDGPIAQEAPFRNGASVAVGQVPVKHDEDDLRALGTGNQAADATAESLLWEDLEEDVSYPFWPTNTGAPLIEHNLPPQSKYAREHHRDRGLRRRWTPKKLRTMELSVDRLILRLLILLDDMRDLYNTVRSAPESFQPLLDTPRPLLEQRLEAVEVRLRAIMLSDPWLTTHPHNVDFSTPVHEHSPRYTQDESDEWCVSTSTSLEHSLRDILDANEAAVTQNRIAYALPKTLVKICYNLSVSPAPPLLPVWNTLLRSFSSPVFSTQVPTALLIEAIRTSHVRMNEETLVLMLNHCEQMDKSALFVKLVRQMNGQMNGLLLARPDINITTSGGAARLVRVKEKKLVQMPYPTPLVFEALIKGVLHFSGFDAALEMCRDMGFGGWGLSIRGLLPLLRDCVQREDWERGEGVWKQMLVLKEKSKRDGKPEKLPLGAWVLILRMREARRQGVQFWETVAEAGEEGGWTREVLLKNVKEDKNGMRLKIKRIFAGGHGLTTTSRLSRLSIDAALEEFYKTKGENMTSPEHADLSGVGEREPDSDNVATTRDSTDASDVPEPSVAGWPMTQKPDLSPSPLPHELEHKHLVGDVAATQELDEYEVRERPMGLNE